MANDTQNRPQQQCRSDLVKQSEKSQSNTENKDAGCTSKKYPGHVSKEYDPNTGLHKPKDRKDPSKNTPTLITTAEVLDGMVGIVGEYLASPAAKTVNALSDAAHRPGAAIRNAAVHGTWDLARGSFGFLKAGTIGVFMSLFDGGDAFFSYLAEAKQQTTDALKSFGKSLGVLLAPFTKRDYKGFGSPETTPDSSDLAGDKNINLRTNAALDVKPDATPRVNKGKDQVILGQ